MWLNWLNTHSFLPKFHRFIISLRLQRAPLSIKSSILSIRFLFFFLLLFLICLLLANSQDFFSLKLLQDLVNLCALVITYEMLRAVLEVSHRKWQLKLFNVFSELSQLGLLLTHLPLGVFLGIFGLLVTLLALCLNRILADV